jgi:hypothetical protein
VVAAALIDRRRWAAGLIALGAVVFMAAMAITGGRRENQQLVRFQAAGLMAQVPDDVDRVDLERDGRLLTLRRSADRAWTYEPAGRPLPAALVTHVETSLRFMHVAEPVRVMEGGEWDSAALGDFGLAPARYVVRLTGKGGPLLAVDFGALNPQRVAQFARVDGRQQLYLMPKFVGVEWERVWDLAAAR